MSFFANKTNLCNTLSDKTSLILVRKKSRLSWFVEPYISCSAALLEFEKEEGEVEKEEGLRFRVHFKHEATTSVSPPPQPNAN